jgi:hypothetical protein
MRTYYSTDDKYILTLRKIPIQNLTTKSNRCRTTAMLLAAEGEPAINKLNGDGSAYIVVLSIVAEPNRVNCLKVECHSNTVYAI